MKTIEIITNGVVAKSEDQYDRVDVRLQRGISEGGDTIAVSALNQEDESTIFIVPTKAVIDLLEKESKNN